MKLLVGPARPESAAAWTDWMSQAIRGLRAERAETGPLCAEALDTVESYVQAWARAVDRRAGVFRWQSDVDADELEYLTNALYNLDAHLSSQVVLHQRRAAPADVEAFHGVLVSSLLRALAAESACRAAFSEQLGQTWPTLLRAT